MADTIPNLDLDHLAMSVRGWDHIRKDQRDRLASHLRMAGYADEAERLQRGEAPNDVADGMVKS